MRWSFQILGVMLLGAVNMPSVAAAEFSSQVSSRNQAGLSAPISHSPGVVNINTASEEELGRLPGIGPSRAKSVLQLRQRLGKFRALTDVIRVRGIGPATYRKLKPMLTLDGPTTLTTKAR